jgi:hypothetical protein
MGSAVGAGDDDHVSAMGQAVQAGRGTTRPMLTLRISLASWSRSALVE